MKSLTLVAAILTLIPSMMLAGEPPQGPATGKGRGELWALVLHSETWVGLTGLPVYVRADETDTGAEIVVATDKQGFAHVTGLVPGNYSVWVSFNNHQSEIATFVIDQHLLAKLTIFFNPDVD